MHLRSHWGPLWGTSYKIYEDIHLISTYIQRSAKRFVNLAKQDPGRARQNR